MKAVMDTNVLVSALRSRSGASYELLRLLREGKWALVLSNTVLGPDDEPLVQLAREAAVLYLVTHNVRDVRGAAQFGVQVLRPAEFLDLVRKAV